MATVGLCYICQAPSARTCQSCGRTVCAAHVSAELVEVCKSCARGMVFDDEGPPLNE